jgi:hypothetical protein
MVIPLPEFESDESVTVTQNRDDKARTDKICKELRLFLQLFKIIDKN